MKYILGLAVLTISFSANAQTPTSKLEYTDGPTSKIDQASIDEITAYTKNAATAISRLKNMAEQISDSEKLKQELSSGIHKMIKDYQNTRSARLLIYSLQACEKMVNFIDEATIQRGLQYTPQGTVDQQVRIMKRTLDFAEKYYQSDLTFVNGVLTKVESKTNPKFVEYGIELNNFVLKLSDGLLSARANYGMIRWSLAVLANNIKNDKELGIAYASTRARIAEVLLKQLPNGQPVYPDLVEHENNPFNDADLVIKVRELKLLAKDSLEEMQKTNVKVKEAKTQAEIKDQQDAKDLVRLKNEAEAKQQAEIKKQEDAIAAEKAKIEAAKNAEKQKKIDAENKRIQKCKDGYEEQAAKFDEQSSYALGRADVYEKNAKNYDDIQSYKEAAQHRKLAIDQQTLAREADKKAEALRDQAEKVCK